MKEFLVVYYATQSASEKMANATSDELEAGMKAWMEWASKCGSGLVDMGSPLANGQVITDMRTKSSSKNVTGYSKLQAESMDAALAMLDGHPHMGWMEGGEIGVFEVMPLPGA